MRRALKRAQEAKVPFEVRCDLQALLQLGLLTVLCLVLPWYGGSLQPLPTPTTRSVALCLGRYKLALRVLTGAIIAFLCWVLFIR